MDEPFELGAGAAEEDLVSNRCAQICMQRSLWGDQLGIPTVLRGLIKIVDTQETLSSARATPGR